MPNDRPQALQTRRHAMFGPWPIGVGWILLVAGALLVVRLLLAPWAVLIPEEAYYWLYSKYLALSYLDHPPMVAWMILGGRALLGDSELGVRLATWLAAVGSTWLCYRLAADWCGRRAGLAAVLLFSITPLFVGAQWVTTPDAPLIFFWLLTLWALTRATRSGRLGWWLLTGLACGLACDSKYPAAALGLGALLFLLSDARGRAQLLRPGPWLALLVAVAVFSPVLIWNAQHDWVSFRFQLARRAAQHTHFVPGHAVAWLAGQFVLLSPLVFVLFTGAWWVGLRRFRHDRSGRWRFAVCFALPWLAVCLWQGLSARVHINWALPAYLSLLPVAVVLMRVPGLLPAPSRRWRPATLIRRYLWTMVVIESLVLLYVTVPIPHVPRPTLFAPWNHVASAAERAEDEFEVHTSSEPFIIAGGVYKLASELAFYMREGSGHTDWRDVIPQGAVHGGGLNYVNWHNVAEFFGRNAVFVTEHDDPQVVATLREYFDRVDPPKLMYEHASGLGAVKRYWWIGCHRLAGTPKQGRRAIGEPEHPVAALARRR